MRKLIYPLIFLAATLPALAQSDDSQAACSPIEVVMKHLSSDAKATPLSHDQWEVMRGIYLILPNTPAGLPPGDSAIIVHDPAKERPGVMFMDGDQVCYILPVPEELIKVLQDLVPKHPGRGA